MGILLVMLGGVFVALANLCMRRSIDSGGNAKAYLTVQLTLSIAVATLLDPVRTGQFAWDPQSAYVGFAGGLLLGVFMLMMGKALEKGTPGLTFAAINASCVMPAVVMWAIFGPRFGHVYTQWHAIGSVLVVLGLFWAGWEKLKGGTAASWIGYLLVTFCLHTLFLAFMQWRALMMKSGMPASPLLPFHFEAASSQWFLPMVFVGASFLQIVTYLTTERRVPKKKEVLYGLLGGVGMGAGTFFSH